MPRVHRGDHTAHIRDQLTRQTRYFTTGAILASLGAATFATVLSLTDEAPHLLTAVGWGLLTVLALIAGLGLLLTTVQYLVYRRREAQLDAAGAEVVDELYTRLHRPETDQ